MVERTFMDKVGACRHRAMDFMIVALYLGVACRYAVSDCHAWPELWHPSKKIWVALDLGGCDPGGPRNPDDLNPPQPPAPPTPPEEEAPPPPEAPEELPPKVDIRKVMRGLGMNEPDVMQAWEAWRKAGGK
jgi:hypothetical protein